MKRIIIAFAALSVFSAPVMAAKATWFNNDQWRVIGDTRGFCTASSVYPKIGIEMTMGVTALGEVKLFLNGTNAIKGNTYTNIFRTGPSVGEFVGYAAAPGMLAYTVTPDTLLKFAYAKTLHVENIGSFDMTGSKEAVLELLKCRKAMNGFDA